MTAGIITRRIVQPRLQVTYPMVYGLSNYGVQQKINNDIYALVYRLIVEQGYFENPMTEITGTYELKTNERGILSLSIINYAFSGGAHGNTLQKSLTFDLHTGQVYELKDLFKPNSNYLARLTEIVRRQIEERELPLIEPFTGVTPNQDFYIADKALVLYFPLYALVPYAYGFPYFPISVYEIEDIIDENGPLGKMLR